MATPSPRVCGAVGIAIALFGIGMNLYVIRTEGKFYLIGCAFAGVLPVAVAQTLLPPHFVLRPKEVGDKWVFDARHPDYTTLGRSLVGVGIALGLLFFLYLKFDF